MHTSEALATTKTCSKCKQVKALELFHRDKVTPDGRKYQCAACCHENCRKWREDSSQHDRERKRLWHQQNREKELDRMAQYYPGWYAENKHVALANSRRRKVAKLQAVLGWDKDLDDLVEREAFQLAALRFKMLGVEHQVDHIVPLRSKRVCGLNNAYNLAVISAVENATKSNRWWPDMWR